jgi:ABC-type branched-subunit amino acid transport system substrate-binding protein
MIRHAVTPRIVAGATTLLVLGFVTACSGGSGDSGTQAAASAGSALTGPAIKVMTWAPEDTVGVNEPGVPAVAKAAAAAINAAGGIKGSKVDVLTCNEKNTPDGALACAQQAIAAHVIAVVGGFSNNGAAYYPLLEKAGIPVIGNSGQSAEDGTSKMSFQVNATSASLFMGLGVIGPKNGCKKVGIVTIDIPAAQQLVQIIKGGLAAAGQSAATVTTVPPTATDFAPIVASATRGGNDCVAAVLGTQGLTQFLKAMKQAGKTQRLISPTVTTAVVNGSGGVDGPTKNALVTAFYPAPSDPAWAGYRADVAKYIDNKAALEAKGANFDAEVEETTWLSYHTFATLAGGLSTVDSAGLVQALNTTTGVDTGGATQPLIWSKPFANPNMLRVVSRSIRYQVIKDGKVTNLDDAWHDLSGPFLGKPLGN